jgi:hypothetical protein
LHALVGRCERFSLKPWNVTVLPTSREEEEEEEEEDDDDS